MENKKLVISKEELTLAKRKTSLSSMRTFLSYIRTSIVIISLAFAFMKIDKAHPIDAFTIILFVLSGLFLVIGIVDYCVTKKMIHSIGSNGDDSSDNES